MFRRFFKSEDGIALAYFAVALPALFGVAVLVIDVARGNNLHLDLQNAADGIALAAAAELDGKVDSIIRANRAIDNLVENQARFGDGGPFIVDQVTIVGIPGELRVFYLDEIPTNDNNPIDAAWVTAHDASLAPTTARFAAVYIEPTNYSLLFPLDIFNETTVPIAASAVAGFNLVICEFTPLFICNPYETSPGVSPDLATIVQLRSERRKMIEMRQKGPSAPYAPGNFGYLASQIGNSGANQLREEIASASPKVCYESSHVDLRPGQVASTRVAFNVRFDLYHGQFSGGGPGAAKSEPKYRPARNVRKGYSAPPGNACNASAPNPPQPANYMALPRDNCFNTSPQTCTEMGGRRGNGIWNLAGYWSTNFGGLPPPIAGLDLPTRYETYRYEINNNMVNTPSNGGERGTPACYTGGAGTISDDPDRRMIYGAIINCLQYGAMMNGSTNDIPVETWASFFLTEPVQQGGPDDDILRAEIVDVTGVFGNGTLTTLLRDNVQLYR